ncbi:MAG: LysM peptidoglycan-binding domain-containing protein, partial [Bacteroidota bacterium]|nr:LysM peptidoglycan-binding domain-containing protein [Bacteroidota bacterium]
MKKLFLLLSLQLLVILLFAQARLMIKSESKGFYLEHKVTAKEGIYSIGRLYSVHPKALAAYNSLGISKGLNLGQVIKIPLTDTNFSQSIDKGVPVYYKVGEKEGLFKVSSNNNKVLMENLRRWNNLSRDNISTGTNLVVGYLVSGEYKNVTGNTLVKNESVNKPVVEVKKEEPPIVKSEVKKEDPKKTDEPKKTEPPKQVS